MAIGNVVQRGQWVTVYNDRGQQTAHIFADNSKPGDGLKGYTSTTVNVQVGQWVYTYDERGSKIDQTFIG